MNCCRGRPHFLIIAEWRNEMAKRKYGKNIAFMMEFVRKFIDEELSRFDITCDFNHHIIQRYDDMYD